MYCIYSTVYYLHTSLKRVNLTNWFDRKYFFFLCVWRNGSRPDRRTSCKCSSRSGVLNDFPLVFNRFYFYVFLCDGTTELWRQSARDVLAVQLRQKG